MPELPEVETVVATLRTLVLNKTFDTVEVYWDNIIAYPKVKQFKINIHNQTIEAIHRRGKYIIFELTDYSLVSHLRMEGKYYVYDTPTPKVKHVHVIFNFTDQSQMHYHDTRKFGKMYLYGKDESLKILEDVGLEPWDETLTAQYLLDKAKNRSITLKQFLLDQSIIAGIGNIYVNEICFKVGLMPDIRASKLKQKHWDQVILETQNVLSEAIKQGGTTIRSYTSSLGVTGLFQQQLLVHNKEDELCQVCGHKIKKKMVAQRGTYYCDTCQKGDL